MEEFGRLREAQAHSVSVMYSKLKELRTSKKPPAAIAAERDKIRSDAMKEIQRSSSRLLKAHTEQYRPGGPSGAKKPRPEEEEGQEEEQSSTVPVQGGGAEAVDFSKPAKK